MFANTLPAVNLAAAPAPVPAAARNSGSSPSPDSPNAQFARLLERQASERRDAERAESGRQVESRQAGNRQTENQQAARQVDNRQADGGRANSKAAQAATAAPPASRSTLSSPAATTQLPPNQAQQLRPARTPQADGPAAGNGPAAPDSATAGAPAAGGKPVVDGDGNSTGGGCLPDDGDDGDSADAGDGTVCDAPPLALTAALPVAAAAAAGIERPGITPIKVGPGQAPDDAGSVKSAAERTQRRSGPFSAAGDQGDQAAVNGRDGRGRRLQQAGNDRQGSGTQPVKPGSGQEPGGATGIGTAEQADKAAAGPTLSTSFAAELQALLPAATGTAPAADAGLATAGAPADVPTDGRLHASPGTPEFAGALGAQLTTFIADGLHHARLELNPADMGPLTVQIRIDGQQAQVHLAAANADTRQALEQAMPQLAGSLREAGLTLSGGGVYEQPQHQPGQPGGQTGQGPGDGTARQRRSGTAAHDGLMPDTGMPLPPRNASAVARRGVVDLVA